MERVIGFEPTTSCLASLKYPIRMTTLQHLHLQFS
jgi:hypothetical protein